MSRKMPRPAGFHWEVAKAIVRADGLPACRWCYGPVRPPRRKWCGEGCVWEWTRRTSWGLTRLAVFQRDLGVCAGCGLDTEALKVESNAEVRSTIIRIVGADGFGFTHYTSPVYHLWEADHIIPVAEGGDWFDLRNLSTLCVRCHRAKSKEQAARRRKPRAPRARKPNG